MPDVSAQAPPPSGVVAQPSPSPPPTRPLAVPRPRTAPPPPSPPKKTFAAPAAAPPPAGGWTVVQSKKATKASKKPLGPQPTVDQRSFELVHAKDIKLDQNEADNVVSAINRALHREGISDVRVERVRCTDTCRLLGVTSPTSTLQTLLQHRDKVPRAARMANTSISDVRPSQRWK